MAACKGMFLWGNWSLLIETCHGMQEKLQAEEDGEAEKQESDDSADNAACHSSSVA